MLTRSPLARDRRSPPGFILPCQRAPIYGLFEQGNSYLPVYTLYPGRRLAYGSRLTAAGQGSWYFPIGIWAAPCDGVRRRILLRGLWQSSVELGVCSPQIIPAGGGHGALSSATHGDVKTTKPRIAPTDT